MFFLAQGQAADCHNLVPIGFDGFVDDADVTEIGLLDSLITSVCAGKLPGIFALLPSTASSTSACAGMLPASLCFSSSLPYICLCW